MPSSFPRPGATPHPRRIGSGHGPKPRAPSSPLHRRPPPGRGVLRVGASRRGRRTRRRFPGRRPRPDDPGGRRVVDLGRRRRGRDRLRLPAHRLRRPHRRGARRPAVGASAPRRPRPVPGPRPRPGRLDRLRVDRAPARGLGDLRDARGHVLRRRHAPVRHRPPRRARGARRRDRRGPPGERLQRRVRLGLRRRALVCGARAVRRPRRRPGVRGRLPRARPRGVPRRGLQPPRAERQPPPGVRPLHSSRRQRVGRRPQPRRRGVRRGAAVRDRQRAAVVRGVPRRRPAPRRRARAARLLCAPRARGAGGRHRAHGRPPGPAAVAGGGVRPQRSAPGHIPRRRRVRAHRPVGRRRAPRDPRRRLRGTPGLLRGLRFARDAAPRARGGVRPRRHLLVVPGPRARPAGRPGPHPREPVRGVHAHPRPGGQPRGRRPPVDASDPRPAAAQGGARAVLAVHADALPGRGVGCGHPVGVLHLPPRARTRRGGPAGPHP